MTILKVGALDSCSRNHYIYRYTSMTSSLCTSTSLQPRLTPTLHRAVFFARSLSLKWSSPPLLSSRMRWLAYAALCLSTSLSSTKLARKAAIPSWSSLWRLLEWAGTIRRPGGIAKTSVMSHSASAWRRVVTCATLTSSFRNSPGRRKFAPCATTTLAQLSRSVARSFLTSRTTAKGLAVQAKRCRLLLTFLCLLLALLLRPFRATNVNVEEKKSSSMLHCSEQRRWSILSRCACGGRQKNWLNLSNTCVVHRAFAKQSFSFW